MAKRAAGGAQRKDAAAAADHRALAARLYGEGRYGEALKAANAALRRCPQDAELWNLSGGAALQLGLMQDAERFWQAAIARDPGCADAHYNIGLLYHRRRDLDAAARAFARAITLRPQHAPALNNLGAVMQAVGRNGEAVTLLQRSVAIDPGNAPAFNNLGLALIALGRFDEAQAALDRALALRPDFVEALTNRGRISMEAGERAAALKFFDAALAADPESAEAHYAKSQLTSAPRGDAWTSQLERAYLKRAALAPARASTLSFAMGKVYEDLGEYEAAFDAYAEGNQLRYALKPFDEGDDERLLEALLGSFGAELYAAEALAGKVSTGPSAAVPVGQRVPILVVGMPRSGTTLIEQALASHPEVFGAGELTTLAELAATLPRGIPSGAERPGWRERLCTLGREYQARLPAGPLGQRYVVDKMPGNYWQLGLVPLMLPEAKIIHVRRDPLDTCCSCYCTAFTEAQEYAFDLGMLGRRYLRYHRLMEHWRAMLPAGSILEVHYEDVVADLEREVRRMLTHIGLPWHEACLDFHENRRAVHTASVMQVRQRLYSGSIGRWRRFARQLEPMRALLAPLLEEGAREGAAPTLSPSPGAVPVTAAASGRTAL